MKISFLLPNIQLRGGTWMVVQYANLLTSLGADVTVVFPTRLRRLPFPMNEIEYLWRAPYKMLLGRWFKLRCRLLPVPSLEAGYIPRADIVIATAWQTAVLAATYPSSRGEKYYFVQDIETYGAGAAAGSTYALPLRKIVDSPWVRARLRRDFKQEAWSLIPNGVDLDLHRPESVTTRSGDTTIGMLLSDERRKGSDVAIRALERLHRDGHRFTLLCIGVTRHHPPVPAGTRLLWRLRPVETPKAYGASQIWICPSRSDGMPLPPMEAMASGCALVTTQVGGTSYYAIPERTALVCKPGDEEGLATAVSRLLKDADLRRRLAEEGVRTIRKLDIRQSAANFMKALSGEQVFVEPETGLEETHCD